MTARALFAGLALLLAAWAGPLPRLAEHSFTAHMLLHLVIVVGATPLLAIALAARHDGVGRIVLAEVSPVGAALLELVVVWAWHAPGLHEAARTQTGAFVAEQVSFLLAGLLFWGTVVAAAASHAGRNAAASMVALVMTFAHMTWLGALLLFSPRPLYQHGGEALHALADQHVGGAAMLLVSALAYVTGGILVGRRLLRTASGLGHAA